MRRVQETSAASRFVLGLLGVFAMVLLSAPALEAQTLQIYRADPDLTALTIDIAGNNFGVAAGFVELEGLPLSQVFWTNTLIRVNIAAGYPAASYKLAVRTPTTSFTNFVVAFDYQDTAVTGAAGATGAAGTNGTNGANGATGVTGAAGSNGTNGANGATGVTGAAGSNGTNGANGATGVSGTAGTNGTNGAAGTTGAAGTNGVNGGTGATGTAGTNGTNGATGTAGAAGTNGASGATGASGTAGTNGTNGTTGATGTAGSNGANGATGATGVTGVTGATGATGIGRPGATGDAGTNGINGINGMSGISGINGATGATGTNGTNGSNGVNGVNGTNGAMGATGPAGPQATGEIGVRKTSDQPRFSTTLGNDTDLKFNIGANETWAFDVFISANANADGKDLTFGFTVPAGAFIKWGGQGSVTLSEVSPFGVNMNSVTTSGAGVLSFGVNMDATSTMVRLMGIVINGATAGAVQLQTAESTFGGTVTVQQNSYLVAHKF